ncbi:MAG: DUF2680 domain-containing protein [bacterium]
MKTLRNRFLAVVAGLAFSITGIASGIAAAQGWNGPGNATRGAGYAQQGGFVGPGPVLRTDMFNARIELLTEMTEQSQETIKAKLRYKPMWAVLDEYKVDYVAFNNKMAEKRTGIINKAVADGKISQDQADFMLQRAEGGMQSGNPGWQKGRRGGRGQRGGGFNCPRY